MTELPAANAEPIVDIRDVHKSFGRVEVLKGVSLAVPKGGVVCIIGPSGSGKSTLLRCINGLVPIDRGSIRVANFDVHTLQTDQEKIALRKEVSIVFQQYNLFPHKTALENVMMAPVHVLKEDKGEVRQRAVALLREGRAFRQGGCLPRRAVRWPAAARRDRPLAGDAARGDAVRRSDRGARSRDRQGGPQHDSRARAGRA